MTTSSPTLPRRPTSTGRLRSSPAEAWVFLREFLRAPLRTASVVPSSRALAEQMLAPLRRRPADAPPPVVVELGPGTGAVTAVVRGHAPAGTRYVGIELSSAMVAALTTRFPGIDVVHGSALELPDVLARRKLAAADLVVSGLPWQAFAGPAGAGLVPVVARCLAVGGTFTQFTYSWSRWAPPGRRQHRALLRSFTHVELSRTVWRNLPPAVVYTACGARTADGTHADPGR